MDRKYVFCYDSLKFYRFSKNPHAGLTTVQQAATHPKSSNTEVKKSVEAWHMMEDGASVLCIMSPIQLASVRLSST